jgi:hypothetical protein
MPTQKVSSRELRIFIEDRVQLNGRSCKTARLPRGVKLIEAAGLVTHESAKVSVLHAWPPPDNFVGPPRFTRTPGGDLLAMFPAGLREYAFARNHCNQMYCYRSSDQGRKWHGPTIPWREEHNQAAFLPLVPHGRSVIYAFGTEPAQGFFNGRDNAVIALRSSEDDGRSWSEMTVLSPLNDPNFRGVALNKPLQTEAGVWLLPAHLADRQRERYQSRQFVLRSADQGDTWEVTPHRRPHGFFLEHGRFDDGQLVSLGGERVLLMSRSAEGRVWQVHSADAGKTWGRPRPTGIINPDEPPAVFNLDGGQTLLALHHNLPGTPRGGAASQGKDGGQLWLSISRDGGTNWSPPRFLMANAAATGKLFGARTRSIDYIDLHVQGQELLMMIRLQQRLIATVSITRGDLDRLPTAAELH